MLSRIWAWDHPHFGVRGLIYSTLNCSGQLADCTILLNKLQKGLASSTVNSFTIVFGKSPGITDLGFFALLIFWKHSYSVIIGGLIPSLHLVFTLSGSRFMFSGLYSLLIEAKCSPILSAHSWSVRLSWWWPGSVKVWSSVQSPWSSVL